MVTVQWSNCDSNGYIHIAVSVLYFGMCIDYNFHINDLLCLNQDLAGLPIPIACSVFQTGHAIGMVGNTKFHYQPKSL